MRLERDQFGAASAVLARAFHDDPAWVWLVPDAERRAKLLPWLFNVGFGVTMAAVYGAGEPLVGAARWVAPGPPTLRVAATLRALVTTPLRLGAATAPFLAYGKAVEQLRTEVGPGPHWYLAGIGVDPAAQRRGVGTALLQPGIEGAERDGLRAVLLTNSERNLTFYERSGFRIVAEGETPEGGPHAWAMVRNP